MRPAIIGVLAIIALLTSPPPAHAQAQQQLASEWSATAAIAVGSGALTCGVCDGERARAPSGYVRVGRDVAAGLILSGELDVWSKSTEWVTFSDASTSARGTARFTIASLNAVAQWYPLPVYGFFVDAGIGIGRYQVSSKSRDVGGSLSYSNTFGYQAGVGYDIPVRPRLAITPSAKIFGFAGAKLEGLEGKAGGNVVQLALGLTWRPSSAK